MDRKESDINQALDFLRNSMNNPQEDTKVRQISAKTLLSYYKDEAEADSTGKKGQNDAAAAKLVKGGKYAPLAPRKSA